MDKPIYFAIIIVLHLYSAFLDPQSALQHEGRSHPPDDVTTAIVHQNAQHTPATGGEETVMKPVSI